MSNNLNDDLSLFNELTTYFLKEEQQNPVSDYISPDKLHKALDLKLSKEGMADKAFRNSLKKVILKSTKSSSKLFFNQLYGGRHSKAVLGDLLSVMLNNSMATYKISGPQTMVEKEVLSEVYKLIGYDKNPGGTFPTGGSMSNFMSLIIARDKVDLKIKEKGVFHHLVAYTSENSHYSIDKNASFAGIGKANVRHIKSDEYGKISVLEFKKQVKLDLSRGLTPFYLNATAGTTVLCAFDNIRELASVCQEHNIWLHLDGAFGGSVIFSEKHNHLVDGISQTDSFCFNAHKTLGAPLSTSVLAVKDKRHLYNSFNNNANYLYQTHNEEYNLGQTSLECGRRNNALKLWSMWKAIGTNGIAKIVEKEFKLAEIARNYVKSNSDYTLYSFEESLSICFNYKDFDPQDLCKRLYESSALMVGFGNFKDKRFVRLVIVNCENSSKELTQFFATLEAFANKNRDVIKKL